MNLTLTQSFHRTQTLSGELKAAESALTDCEADANAKARIASIAAEAVDKAKAHLETLRQEREELAEHMAALVRKTGEPIDLPDSNSAFWNPPADTSDLADRLMARSEEKMNGAFDQATQ